MKAEKIVIMFLSCLLFVGCQSAEKNTLFRTSDQMDSSQGTALPAEPIEKDPTQIDQGAVDSNKKKSSQRWYVDRRRGVNPETTPAMGPQSVN